MPALRGRGGRIDVWGCPFVLLIYTLLAGALVAAARLVAHGHRIPGKIIIAVLCGLVTLAFLGPPTLHYNPNTGAYRARAGRLLGPRPRVLAQAIELAIKFAAGAVLGWLYFD